MWRRLLRRGQPASHYRLLRCIFGSVLNAFTLQMQGDDALGFINEMQRLFAADIDLAVGNSITSALLNQNGNYIAIADVHRLDNNK